MTKNDASALLAEGSLVTQVEAAKIIGIAKGTLSYHGRQGHQPQPIGVLGKSLIYWRADVLAEAKRREPLEALR